MNRPFRSGFAAATLFLIGAAGLGCQQSSHKSVRMYEYSNEPAGGDRRAAQPVEEKVQDDGEWQMVAPGEMVVEPD